MSISKKLLFTVVMSVLIGTGVVHANEQREKGHEFKGIGRAKIFKQLNLSEDQKKQLEANKMSKKQEMKESFKQMKALRQELKQELMKAELDMAKINSINTQIKNAQAQRADRKLQTILEVRKILTPEQFDKFSSMMEERREKWMNKDGHGTFEEQEAK